MFFALHASCSWLNSSTAPWISLFAMFGSYILRKFRHKRSVQQLSRYSWASWPLGPMASPCFVAPLSTSRGISSPMAPAAVRQPQQRASLPSQSLASAVPAATLLALGSRKLHRRRAKNPKVQRRVIGPAVAAAAAAAKVAAAGKLAAAGGAAASVAAGIKTLSKERPAAHKSGRRPKMVVLGTGWGSVTFLQGLSEDIAKYYDITVASCLQQRGFWGSHFVECFYLPRKAYWAWSDMKWYRKWYNALQSATKWYDMKRWHEMLIYQQVMQVQHQHIAIACSAQFVPTRAAFVGGLRSHREISSWHSAWMHCLRRVIHRMQNCGKTVGLHIAWNFAWLLAYFETSTLASMLEQACRWGTLHCSQRVRWDRLKSDQSWHQFDAWLRTRWVLTVPIFSPMIRSLN